MLGVETGQTMGPGGEGKRKAFLSSIKNREEAGICLFNFVYLFVCLFVCLLLRNQAFFVCKECCYLSSQLFYLVGPSSLFCTFFKNIFMGPLFRRHKDIVVAIILASLLWRTVALPPNDFEDWGGGEIRWL